MEESGQYKEKEQFSFPLQTLSSEHLKVQHTLAVKDKKILGLFFDFDIFSPPLTSQLCQDLSI